MSHHDSTGIGLLSALRGVDSAGMRNDNGLVAL